MATLYLRNKTWWVKYYPSPGARPVFTSLKTADRTVAKFRKNEIENKIKLGTNPLPDKNIQIKEAYDQFIRHVELTTKPRTILYYKESLDPVIKTFGDTFKVQNIRNDDLIRYIEGRNNLKLGGRWHVIKTFKTFLNFCVTKNYISKNPISAKKPNLPKRPPECWSKEEAAKILSVATGTAYDLIFLNLHLGLRPAELIALEWEDIKWDSNFVVVREAKDNEFRRIPLHNTARKFLEKLKKPKGLIFPGINEHRLRSMAKRVKNDAQMPHIKRFWYAVRHTFATEYYKQTGDLKGLQEILGHAKIQMTLVYVNPQQEHQQKQMNKLSYSF